MFTNSSKLSLLSLFCARWQEPGGVVLEVSLAAFLVHAVILPQPHCRTAWHDCEVYQISCCELHGSG